jgi:hypothetical protein
MANPGQAQVENQPRPQGHRRDLYKWPYIYPDDDDRDGHRNVGIQRTPNAADSPRRFYQNPKGVLNIMILNSYT